MSQRDILSVIVPIYEEAEIIEQSLLQLHAVLSRSAHEFEIIVADDGSTDRGSEIAACLANEMGSIRLLRHPVNRGRGFILMQAIRHSLGGIVSYIDADLQIDPRVIPRLADRIRGGADLAIGSKYHGDSRLSYSPWRRLQSGVYCSLVRLLLGLDAYDCQCGAKAFRREAVERLLPHMTCNRWSWDTELILKGSLLGLSIAEVPVIVGHNPDRKSKVRMGSALGMSGHLLRLWMWSRRSGKSFVREVTGDGAPVAECSRRTGTGRAPHR